MTVHSFTLRSRKGNKNPRARRSGYWASVGLVALLLLPAAVHGAASPAAPDPHADDALIATVRQKAKTILHLATAATNTVDLAARICMQPVQTDAHTNTNVTVQPNLPAPEPIFNLRGLSTSTGKPLALLNGRWFAEGDLVSTDGIRISKIGGDRVVLVDKQGVERVVKLYRDRK